MFYLDIYEKLKTSHFHNVNFTDYEERIIKEKTILKNSHQNSELLKIWFVQTSIDIIKQYYNCFSLLKKHCYKDAWIILEKIEINFINIKFNEISYFDCPVLVYIEKYVSMFQEIYPYKLFGSPEVVHKKVICSICGKTMIPFSDCRHITGKVYEGEMCYGIVKDMDFISVSIVTKPSQKYSVIFDDIDNPGKYKVLEYLIPKLKSEFIHWSYTKHIEYIPYKNYNTQRNGPCPCGSGKKFKKCCLINGKGIVYPHFEFIL